MYCHALTSAKPPKATLKGRTTSDLESLAIGAKVAAAISNGETLDGSTADRARLATEVSDTEVELGSAQLAIRAFICINTGAFAADS